ncbi:hypothetical protein JY651_14665 [Pyxidicoccus parkwayensis]|uniref:Uncharacterized protein n=1 Tax=Pyxidicoccus parkwayensis TaxID=2813578 RepID=A0ABX7P6K9_9BACT|nr:hypothetical protein [Pyxidicoccus parkwaysis]QSQ26087.1 hypothetical protein JY651_14665 [Pyxidicoccus parkwaysis]
MPDLRTVYLHYDGADSFDRLDFASRFYPLVQRHGAAVEAARRTATATFRAGVLRPVDFFLPVLRADALPAGFVFFPAFFAEALRAVFLFAADFRTGALLTVFFPGL